MAARVIRVTVPVSKPPTLGKAILQWELLICRLESGPRLQKDK